MNYLKRLSSFRRKTSSMIYVFYSSHIKPVKLSYDVFQEKNSQISPLIIMHGLLGSKRNWRNVCKNLVEKLDNKIYALDARNHGDSPHDNHHNSESMTEDVIELMRQENINKALLMGHSMGGRTMMYAALKYPELIEKAIIVDVSPINVPRDVKEMSGLFQAMENISFPSNIPMAEGRKLVEKQLYNEIGDNGIVNFIMLNLQKVDGKYSWKPNVAALRNNIKYFDNFMEQISNFKPYQGPVIFIGGKYSGFIDPNDYEKIQKIFPKATLTWLETGHLVHFEEPEKFINIVVDFIKN